MAELLLFILTKALSSFFLIPIQNKRYSNPFCLIHIQQTLLYHVFVYYQTLNHINKVRIVY